jgi:hypothetical protein
MRQNRRVVIFAGNAGQEVVDPHEQTGQRRPVVPEHVGGQGDVAVLGQRIAVQQAVQDGFFALETAAVDDPHIGIGVDQIQPPTAVDFGRRIPRGDFVEHVLQLVLSPVFVRRHAFHLKAARQHAQPLGSRQRPDHDGVLRRHVGRDAVLGGEPRHQRRRLVRTALRIQVGVEGQVLEIGRRTMLLVAPQRAEVVAAGLQHAADEQALTHLRRAVHGRRHGHLGRTVQVGGQAA